MKSADIIIRSFEMLDIDDHSSQANKVREDFYELSRITYKLAAAKRNGLIEFPDDSPDWDKIIDNSNVKY